MNKAEKSIVHEAMAEVMHNLQDDDHSPELRHFAFGMRYVAALLGMPEGSITYDWSLEQDVSRAETTGIPIQGIRASRREQILRKLTRR
jgi:hypothetical protein